jgi:hypothetical protein
MTSADTLSVNPGWQRGLARRERSPRPGYPARAHLRAPEATSAQTHCQEACAAEAAVRAADERILIDLTPLEQRQLKSSLRTGPRTADRALQC